MATIQLRRNTGAIAVPAPAAGADGEPFWAKAGFTNLPGHAGGNDVGVWDGTALVPLISPLRQVEVVGDQAILGTKTITGAGILALGGVANLTLGDGTAGDILTKGAGGLMTWSTPAAGTTYVWGVGLDETTPGTIDLEPATAAAIGGVSVAARGAAQGLALTAAGALSLVQATDALMGGVVLALNADMDIAAPGATAGVTPANVRALIGAPVSTLATAAKTVVPAINELAALVTGHLQFAGSYDVVADEVDPVGAGPNGPLPAASAAFNGKFVICTTAGTGTGNAAGLGNLAVEDWIICGEVPTAPGTYALHKLSVGSTAVTAENVAITAIAGITATDVQGALEELQASKLEAVEVLPSITGDGTTADPLDVAIVDGGAF